MPSSHFSGESIDGATRGLYEQERQERMNKASDGGPNHREAERQRRPHVLKIGLANGVWMVLE